MSEEHSSLSRRGLLAATAAAGAAAVLPTGPAEASRTPGRTRPVPGNPFTLGVASGDPTSDGVVLWTRLAKNPLAEDGHGGMPDTTISVSWQVATDDRFSSVVQHGTVDAVYDWAHSVHVEVSGLEPSRDYWYRFHTRFGGWSYGSPTGRTRTAPAADSLEPLTMGIVSCSHWGWGYWTCYRHLADENPDLVLHLGDYFYEGARADGQVRTALPETGAVTLANYRQRYAQYHTDADLQAAHAAAPWLVVFDDHEVVDDWYRDDKFIDRRTAGFRAFYENVPLRRSSLPSGSSIPLYRRIRWGRLANLHMLDTRQYRDEHACPSGWRDCPGRLDPDRTLTGDEQERWLIDGFANSGAVWDILGQQVPLRQLRHPSNPALLAMDKWDGYVASRDRVLAGWVASGAQNLLVLDGDVHQFWAAEIKADFDDPESETIGTELTTTSISSGADGSDVDLSNDPWLQANPHVKYHNMRRGYTLATVTSTEVTAHLRGVDYVTTPGAPLQTRATYRIKAGQPGLEPVYIQPPPEVTAMLTPEQNIRASLAAESAD